MSADLALHAKAWPFEQARLLKKRLDKLGRKSGPVVFETGYGPSGLPHMGTFGEVVRTTMVLRAFDALTGGAYQPKLICVSDDMDGMRKVPPHLPDQDMLHQHLHEPLTVVPDPFGTHDSFGAHMNARLQAFLDSFGFDYEFASATQFYRDGVYDAMLQRAVERFDDIMKVMLPTLGAERQATYSPFLPISPSTGRVLYVPMKSVDAKAGTITFDDEDGSEVTLPVTGGRVKLQWKPDFGMRWAALGVDFEMFGKDHQANAPVYSRICKILGAEPPTQFVYELFLDQVGEKISKSKGNGLSVEEWLRYAPPESLSYYNFVKPRTAKRLFFDVIPKAVDEYMQHLGAYHGQDEAKRLENPVWHIHNGNPPQDVSPISFALLLNLASASSAHNTDVMWGFISSHLDGVTPQSHPMLDQLAGFAVKYFEDFVQPTKSFRAADAKERAAMQDLLVSLRAMDPKLSDGSEIQSAVFAVGKAHEFEPLRDWFKALYEVLLGQSQGPRFGSFVAIYGIPETIALIEKALAGEMVGAS
jgi:lysyl-tRNA synthetase class 1